MIAMRACARFPFFRSPKKGGQTSGSAANQVMTPFSDKGDSMDKAQRSLISNNTGSVSQQTEQTKEKPNK